MGNELLKYCLEKGFLLDKEMLELLNQIDIEMAIKIVDKINMFSKERLITRSFIVKNQTAMKQAFSDLDEKVVIEKIFVNLGMQIEITKEIIEKPKKQESAFKILQNNSEKSRKIEVQDFVKYFKNRFESLRNILKDRQELQGLVSLNKISGDRQGFSIIGIVYSKRTTKNKNILLEIEDNTGRVSALINHSKQELYEKAKDILLDDIIGLKCSGNREIVFVNDIVYPDIFLQEKKRNKEEELAVFISDIHIGSKNFLEKNFTKFIDWINGKYVDTSKIKYLFLVGDNIDGVVVHPTQESFLIIKDLKGQYDKLAEYLGKIRKDIKIIMCPGQHDATRLAEPQPAPSKEHAATLYAMENVYIVSNPALIQIGDAGFKVLMYHGDSIHDFISEIESLRLNRGQDNPAKAIKEILKRRHLAPIHSKAVYVPSEEDALVIREVPDIITTGEMHRADIDMYNNILIIGNSCWQAATPYEEKMGNHPIPCKVPVFNLKTREIQIMDFYDEKKVGGEKVENKIEQIEGKEEKKIEQAENRTEEIKIVENKIEEKKEEMGKVEVIKAEPVKMEPVKIEVNNTAVKI